MAPSNAVRIIPLKGSKVDRTLTITATYTRAASLGGGTVQTNTLFIDVAHGSD